MSMQRMIDRLIPSRSRRVGKYELIRTIGEGNFAKVKYAVNTETHEAVAIKVISRNTVSNIEVTLKREIIAMKLVQHPNIVQLKEVLATKTHVYIVTELVSGGELFDEIVRSGHIHEHRAMQLFGQMLSAVHHCHTHGIVHRDLKPENILLDGSGNVKIADFGLSTINSTDSTMDTSCGTPSYTAPEVLFAQGYDGVIADVWSLGCILFTMLCGGTPFEEPHLGLLLQRIRDVHCRDFPEFVSVGARDFVRLILQPNPLSRISISEMFEHPFVRHHLESRALMSRGRSLTDNNKISDPDIDRMIDQHVTILQTPRNSREGSTGHVVGVSSGIALPNMALYEMNICDDLESYRPHSIGVLDLIANEVGVRMSNMLLQQRGGTSSDITLSVQSQFATTIKPQRVLKILQNVLETDLNVKRPECASHAFKLRGEISNSKIQTKFKITILELLPPEAVLSIGGGTGVYIVQTNKLKGSAAAFQNFYDELVNHPKVRVLVEQPRGSLRQQSSHAIGGVKHFENKVGAGDARNSGMASRVRGSGSAYEMKSEMKSESVSEKKYAVE